MMALYGPAHSPGEREYRRRYLIVFLPMLCVFLVAFAVAVVFISAAVGAPLF